VENVLEKWIMMPEVIYSKCGKCAHPLPEVDSALYTVSYFQNNPPKKKKQIEPT